MIHKCARILAFFIISLSISFVAPQDSFADSCESMGVTSSGLGGIYQQGTISSLPVTVHVATLDPNEYYLSISRKVAWRTIRTQALTPSNNRIEFEITDSRAFNPVGWINKATFVVSLSSQGNYVCSLGEYTIVEEHSCGNILIFTDRDGKTCYGGQGSQGCLADEETISVQAVEVREGLDYYDGLVDVKVTGVGKNHVFSNVSLYNGSTQALQVPIQLKAGKHKVIVQKTTGKNFCEVDLVINNACSTCQENFQDILDEDGENAETTPYVLCDQLPVGSNARTKCEECAMEGEGGDEGEEGRAGIWTAVGCIKRSPKDIIGSLMSLGLTMGGGIALLMILGSGFILSTSAGDPKRTGEAKEMLVAAITGLIFVIFSVAILQFIGYSVLQIPGFGG